MKPSRTLYVLVILLALAVMTSCNLPTAQTTEIIPTQTLEAAVPTQTEQLPTATLTLTATLSMPTATVTTATNCRTGPGAEYGFVMLFTPGMSAPVVGKYTPSYYWIISLTNGGTCWLWGAYANVVGDLSVLPEMTPSYQPVAGLNPTASSNNSGDNNSGSPESENNDSEGADTGGSDTGDTSGIGPLTLVTPIILVPVLVPLTPTSLKASSYCEYSGSPPFQVTLRTDTLVWAQVDKTDGYIIYMNGAQIFKVSKNTLGYQIPANMSVQASTYGIASYLSSVTSSIRSVTPKGCQ